MSRGASRGPRTWRGVLEAVLRRPLLVLGALVAALVVAAAACGLVPPRYRASAHLRAEWDSEPGGTPSSLAAELAQRRSDAVRQRVLSPPALEAVGVPSSAVTVRPGGRRGDFFIDCVRADPAEAARIPSALARLLVVEAEHESLRAQGAELSALEARLADAKKAMDEAAAAIVQLRARQQPAAKALPALDRLAREYGDARQTFLDLEEQRRALRAARPDGAGRVRFTVLEAALPPKAPFFPSPSLFILVGAALGLVAGVIAAVFAERRDRSVRGPEDLRATFVHPILAEIPLVRVSGRGRRAGSGRAGGTRR